MASLGGSVLVGRRETIRAHRVELYRGLIPEALEGVTGSTFMNPPRRLLVDVIDDFQRASTVAGRTERKHAGPAIAALVVVLKHRNGDWEPPFDTDMAAQRAEAERCRHEAIDSLHAYSDGLARRIT